MKIVVETDGSVFGAVEISESALDQVRGGFNPSGNHDVAMAKAVAAAFLTLCEQQKARGSAFIARSASVAYTECEGAAMHLVKAITYDGVR